MRPDQHKQKKNAQYKKKHGLQTKSNVEQDKGKGGGGRGRGKGRGQGGKWEQEPGKNEPRSTIHASSALDSDDNQVDNSQVQCQ